MKALFATLVVVSTVLILSGCNMLHHVTDNDDSSLGDSTKNNNNWVHFKHKCGDSTIKKSVDSSNYEMNFNGYNSYLEVPSSSSLNLCAGSYTIETWVYYNHYGGGWQVIIGKDNTDANTEFLLTADGPTSKFRFQTRDFTTVLYSNTTVQAGKWYHLAAVQDISANSVKLYVNGVLESQTDIRGRVVETDYPIHIATRINSITNGYPWYVIDGALDDMRIWNVARTETQIQSTMNTTLKGNEVGLVSYFSFDEGKGSVVVDHTGNGHSGEFHNGPAYAISTAPIH